MRRMGALLVVACGRINFGPIDAAPDAFVPAPSCVTQLAGHTHMCAVKASGDTFCWGSDTGGEIGDGVAGGTRVVSVPARVPGAFVHAGTGGHWSCWLAGDGSVSCAGKNNHGQLGRGTTTTFETTIMPIAGLPPMAELVVGAQHACAHTAIDDMWCWGCSDYTSGADCTTFSASPTLAATGVRALGSVDRRGGCFADTAGEQRCWGQNENAQLGDGTFAPRALGSPTVPAVTAIDVAQSRRSACGLSSEGRVACWGNNQSGQLGRGTVSVDELAAVDVGLSDVSQIGGGDDHFCARTHSGALWCWGSNVHGQLGLGDIANRTVPTLVPLDGVTAIGLASFATCAARADGVYCWGANVNGLVGNGTAGLDVTTPTPSLVTCP